jgi:hypothetical protein
LLTRAEKEKRVIELYEQDAAYRTIAKEVHFSLGRISSIIKRHNGELEVKGGNGEQRQREETIDTQVFKLFEEGRNPVQVAIELDLKSDEVTRLYKKWWELKGLYDLNQLYEEAKDYLFELHAAYKLVRDEGVAARQLVDAANCLKRLPLLENRLSKITNEVQNMEGQKQTQMNELCQLRNDVTITKQDLDSYSGIINDHKEEIRKLIDQIQQLEGLIARLKSKGAYRRIERVAEQKAREVLTDNRLMLQAALCAVIKALRNEHDMWFLIDGSAFRNQHQNYTQACETKVLELAERTYNHLLHMCVDSTMSPPLGVPKNRPPYSAYRPVWRAI